MDPITDYQAELYHWWKRAYWARNLEMLAVIQEENDRVRAAIAPAGGNE